MQDPKGAVPHGRAELRDQRAHSYELEVGSWRPEGLGHQCINWKSL